MLRALPFCPIPIQWTQAPTTWMSASICPISKLPARVHNNVSSTSYRTILYWIQRILVASRRRHRVRPQTKCSKNSKNSWTWVCRTITIAASVPAKVISRNAKKVNTYTAFRSRTANPDPVDCFGANSAWTKKIAIRMLPFGRISMCRLCMSTGRRPVRPIWNRADYIGKHRPVWHRTWRKSRKFPFRRPLAYQITKVIYIWVKYRTSRPAHRPPIIQMRKNSMVYRFAAKARKMIEMNWAWMWHRWCPDRRQSNFLFVPFKFGWPTFYVGLLFII